ncbi:hypothetical protein CEXT_25741 [Caerostris extrusa]|uniref:Uncharacterized protein n=1 Tax=Caerostris extrusa TaxID=172846 RepID=A0AAV4Y673_CAEEX|nr:hypothetical protein CEXT_25741 [Caerostris extrusa]
MLRMLAAPQSILPSHTDYCRHVLMRENADINDAELLLPWDIANNQSRRHNLDDFTRGCIITKTKCRRLKCNQYRSGVHGHHSTFSCARRAFQTARRGFRFINGCPRAIKTTDDRYIVVHVRRNRRLTAAEIPRHMQRTIGHVYHALLWTGSCPNVVYIHSDHTSGVKCFLQMRTDSGHLHIWRVKGTRIISSTSSKRTALGARIRDGIMLGSRIDRHILWRGPVIGDYYRRDSVASRASI